MTCQNYPAHTAYKEGASTQDNSLQNKQESDDITNAGEPQELSKNCGNSLESQMLVRAITQIPLHLHRVGGSVIQVLWPICKVITELSDKHPPRPFQTKGTSRINRALSHAPGLPTQGYSSSVSQHLRHHRHLLNSNWPAKTTQYTEPIQWPSTQGHLFQDWRKSYFVSYK